MKKIAGFAVAALATLVLCVAAASAAAAGSSLSCGTVISSPGVYVLAHDLSCPGFFVQVLGATGVTINLNGHSVSGTGMAWQGIDIESSDVLIENGSIRGFDIGVFVSGSAQITNVRLAKNRVGILVDTASIFQSDAVVQSSFVNENTGDGITVGANSFLQMSNSQVAGNGGDGITAFNAGVSVSGSVISRNHLDGINTWGYGTGLTNNVIANNGGDGVNLGENPFPFDTYNITGNTATGNGGHGIVYEADIPDVVVHTVHAEGNVAYSNSLNPQCVNIFCKTS